MRTLLSFQNGWSYALLLSIAIGCKQSDSSDVTPDSPPCQVQTMTSATVENGKTSVVSSSTFNYDAKGQLTSVVTNSPGSISTKTTKTYTYDDNGYQTAYKFVSTGILGNATTSEDYSYENGRLSKTSFEIVGQSIGSTNNQTIGSTAYTYDAAGTLAQAATSSTNKAGLIGFPSSTITKSSTHSYTNGVLTSIKELINGKETTKYTVENGGVTLETSSNGSKQRYTYNADGHQTKWEEVNAGNAVTSTKITEYGSTPAPKSVYPIQKGFPIIPPSYGKEERMVSRSTTVYSANSVTDFLYKYQLNSKGYPANSVITNNATSATTTTTYTYANCPN